MGNGGKLFGRSIRRRSGEGGRERGREGKMRDGRREGGRERREIMCV